MARRRIEVQHLDEEPANLASPLGRGRGEDISDAVLDFNGVVTVYDGHRLVLDRKDG